MSPRSVVLPGHRARTGLLPPRRAARAALMALAALVLVLGPGAGLAAAHDTLIGSDPADGAALEAAPGSLVLTFSSDQLDVGAAVAVTGPDGTAWADGAPVVDGPTVTQALAPQMPSGAYAVEWRSVSSDGHPISGALTFTVTVPEPVVTPEATEEPELTGADETASPVADDADEVEPVGDDVQQQDDSAIAGGPWVALGVAAAAVAALGTLIALRRRAGNGPEARADDRG